VRAIGRVQNVDVEGSGKRRLDERTVTIVVWSVSSGCG
jgi:hypothetical protein